MNNSLFFFFLTFLLVNLCNASDKKTICLNMIVKNESAVIERCLRSVLPLIDAWVIVDTGSTDGTQEIITQFLKDIPGELVEKKWVNFGFNRQEALQLAKEKGDYILFMDADDILVFSKEFQLPPLTKDFYAIATHSNGIECLLPRLVKSSIDWHWEGVLHEYLMTKEATAGLILEGVEYVYISDGARAKDPQRYLKDIEILEKALTIDPSNARNLFYLGKTYLFAQNLEKAMSCYQKRVTMGGFEEEIFCSYLDMAKIQEVLWQASEASYINAYKCRPNRMEPLYYLAHKARMQGDAQKGYELTQLALTIPPTDTLFVEKWIYDYGLLFEHAVCASLLEKYPEALDACTKLLTLALPSCYKTETLNLYQEAAKKNQELVQKRILDLVTNTKP